MKRAFFIGIKGVGMTALALAMADAGWEVAGSDTNESFITDEILAKRQVPVSPLGSPIPPVDLLIYSAAYEPPQASVRSLPLAEALAEFVQHRKVIAIAGVGGKTTTSAMLAALFHAAGRDVGYYVGTSTIAGLDSPGHHGTDPYYVVESDEYAISKTDQRPKFAVLSPQVVVTTNIVHDHPDIYANEDETVQVFQALISRLPPNGVWVACDSDRLTQKIINAKQYQCQVITYSAAHPLFNQLSLSVFGSQNRLDALAAVLAAQAAGLSEEIALRAISAYRGAGRRQEFHGEAAGRLLYDDYGHHPREIEVTINSFKARFPGKRVILVFESHTYSRTESLLSEFAPAIATADLPFLMPIFESAREKGKSHSITPASFAAEVAKYNPQVRSLTWDNAAQVVAQASQPGDLILTMGAGFVYKLHQEFKELLK